nr:uncharacterized mitochondrial protein AtMg00810-like [Tanacetum cinerariifolium]
MNKLVKGNLVRGLPSKLFENDQACVACQKGKQHIASCNSKTENSINFPLHLLHMDLFGPTFVKSIMKKMYCLVVTDDYSRAFLYGKIEEEVYVCQPSGFEDPDFPDRVYKVEKELFGLHQALRAWYETLSTYLLDNGFQKGKIDKTLFIRRHKGDILLVQVYVDDFIFGSTKNELCIAFEKMIHEKFQMSSMGELTFFLGLQMKVISSLVQLRRSYTLHLRR